MPLDFEITMLHYDAEGRLYWRSRVNINNALLTVLRFARQNPGAVCTIELHETNGRQCMSLHSITSSQGHLKN